MDKNKMTEPVISDKELTRVSAKLDERAKNDDVMSHEEFQELLHSGLLPESINIGELREKVLDKMDFETYCKFLAKNPELKKAVQKDFWDRVTKDPKSSQAVVEPDNGREM